MEAINRRKKVVAKWEFDNPMDKHAVKDVWAKIFYSIDFF